MQESRVSKLEIKRVQKKMMKKKSGAVTRIVRRVFAVQGPTDLTRFRLGQVGFYFEPIFFCWVWYFLFSHSRIIFVKFFF